MVISYSQIHRKDKYPQQSSTIWPVWLHDRVFVYELIGCGFESRCYHLISFFLAKFTLANLVEKFSAVKLLNFGLIKYLSKS